MTNSRIAEGAAIRLPRLFSFLLLAALPLGAATPRVPQHGLAGRWRGVDHGTTITILILPNGQYIEHAQSGTRMIRKAGQFRRNGSNRFLFLAGNSTARTSLIDHATTTAANSSSPGLRTAAPLGAKHIIVFQGPNRIVLTDEETHRRVTLTRLR